MTKWTLWFCLACAPWHISANDINTVQMDDNVDAVQVALNGTDHGQAQSAHMRHSEQIQHATMVLDKTDGNHTHRARAALADRATSLEQVEVNTDKFVSTYMDGSLVGKGRRRRRWFPPIRRRRRRRRVLYCACNKGGGTSYTPSSNQNYCNYGWSSWPFGSGDYRCREHSCAYGYNSHNVCQVNSCQSGWGQRSWAHDYNKYACLQDCRCPLGTADKSSHNGCGRKSEWRGGAVACVSCIGGYRLDDYVCIPHQCKCVHGTPLSPGDEAQQACIGASSVVDVRLINVEVCGNCNTGWYQAGKHKCKACTICDSANGWIQAEPCNTNTDTKCHCKAGWFMSDTRCVECKGQFYSPTAGSKSCTTIPDGHKGKDRDGDGGYEEYEGDVCQQPNVADPNGYVDSSKCANDAAMGTTCELSCHPGYTTTAKPYKCLPDVHNPGNAEYQNGELDCVPYSCTCQHGTGSIAKDCYKNGADDCESCDTGYKPATITNAEGRQIQLCEPNLCTCVNGTGSTAEKCPDETIPTCTYPCNEGYYINDIECTPNMCACDNGDASEREDCPKHGNAKCASCEKGYTMDDNHFCFENVCKCENGQHTVNTECPTHGTNYCNACDPGYILVETTGQCKMIQCGCEHGIGATLLNCPGDGAMKCASCHDLYDLVDDECLPCASDGMNKFTEGTSDICCPTLQECVEPRSVDDPQFCTSINPNHNVLCWSEKLMCRATCPKMACDNPGLGFVDNGEDITGWLKSCPIGYPHVAKTKQCTTSECRVNPDRNDCCKPDTCECPHGTPTVAAIVGGTGGTLCEKNGDVDCSDCKVGFRLDMPAARGLQTCKPNVCKCTFGTAATSPTIEGTNGAVCENHGAEDCGLCNSGYYLSAPSGAGSQTCLSNVCTCANGVPTVANGNGKTLCETHGTHDCSECHVGYEISGGKAGAGTQTCNAKICSTDNLPSGERFDVTGCNNAKTTQSCAVSCANGYTGESTSYTCGSDGQLTGSQPNCEPEPCKSGEHDTSLFTAHTVAHTCTGVTTGGQCTASCATGYSGSEQTYICTANGFEGQPMDCKPDPCDASAKPINGDVGECTDNLQSGATCTIHCNDGYTITGETSCLAGHLTHATCEPTPCDAGQPPAYGNENDCPISPATMKSGSKCQPKCKTGWTVSGETTCNLGKLTSATCEPDLKCELIYEKECADNWGYWSADPEHLDYPGCEAFCNSQQLAVQTNGHSIQGCELTPVDSAVRSTQGWYCLAHLKSCTMKTGVKNAAAKCVHYGVKQ